MTRFRRLLVSFYLTMAVLGAVLPFTILWPWALLHGLAVSLFFAEAGATIPARMVSADLAISATVFMALVLVEGRRADMPRLWLYPLAAVGVGVCCAFPLFLAIREIALTRRERSSPATA